MSQETPQDASTQVHMTANNDPSAQSKSTDHVNTVAHALPADFPVIHRPEQVAADAWIAPNAVVFGDVTLSEKASVWFGAVIRGDAAPVRVGQRSNVQDLCVLHADPGFPCTIGDDVTIGHGAIVHGATVENEVLIGIRAVVLNGARIGTGSIVGAGALVKEGQEIPPRSLVVGIPARVARSVTDEDLERIRHGAEHYVAASAAYRAAE